MKKSLKKIRLDRVLIIVIAVVVASILIFEFFGQKPSYRKEKKVEPTPQTIEKPKTPEVKKLKISANGDLLYHLGIIRSAKRENGYDFTENYELIQPFISSMDFAIANYEGSINKNYAYNGYPLFNAPSSVTNAIKEAGYDAIALANNHILDSNIEGMISTKKYFDDLGLTTFGVSLEKNNRIVYKTVNGIKLALVAYTYGFNGMEANVTSDKAFMLHRIDPEIIQQDLQEAEKNADMTIAFPHMGYEYHLEPNEEQVTLYRNMVKWGADLIFGNHPHVVQPTEMVQHEGTQKYIIYSMGNLISNQRIETMQDENNYEWTERGVIVEANISKTGDNKAVLDNIVHHPTWVRRQPRGTNENGQSIFKYQVLLTENYVNDQKDLTEDEFKRVKATHQAVLDKLKIKQ